MQPDLTAQLHHLGLSATTPPDATQWTQFLQQISQTYTDSAAETTAVQETLLVVGHELRSPLIAMMHLTQSLLTNELTAGQQQQLETIQENSSQLLILLNNLLDFAQKEQLVQQQPFHLPHIIQASCALFTAQAEQKGIRLFSHIEDDCLRDYLGDELRLRQILVNLISNAIKYTPQGMVWVLVNGRSLSPQAYELSLSIKDTGPGIDPQLKAHLFTTIPNQFHTHPNRGAGLGLTITHKLVTLLNGRIWVESKPQQGTTFHVTLPLIPNPNPPPPATTNPHILLIENNATSRQASQTMLALFNLHADEATNGRSAIQQIQTHPYDLILLDWRLPDTTPHQIIETIQQQPHPTRIYILSAAPPTHNSLNTLAIAGFFLKPLTKENVAALLHWPHPLPKSSAASFNQISTSLLPYFWHDAFNLLPQIENALQQQDWPLLQSAAHSLKGSCLSAGLDQAAAYCAQLETAVPHTPVAHLQQTYNQLVHIISNLHQQQKNPLNLP